MTVIVFLICAFNAANSFCHCMFQNTMAVLQSELQDLRNQFEESLNSHQSTKNSLTAQVRELDQQREHAQQEVKTFKSIL